MGHERFRLTQDPGIEVTLRRAARARRLSLRVSSIDGRVTLTVPARACVREARAFAEDRADWIRAARTRAPEPVEVGPGTVLPVEGEPHIVAEGAGRCLADGRITVPGGRPTAVAAVLRTLAQARLAAACDRHAAAIGKPIGRIVLRDTRSRWGSCSTAGRLMFSWRLIMAPPFALDYVAAHEVAHLERMDHSPRFWSLVADLCPDWRNGRDWLRAEGAGLHRFRFGA